MSEDQRYNGWTNYETWCVKLWIDNDWSSNAIADIVNNDCDSIADVANYFRQMHEEDADDIISGASVFADLLRASLRVVSWHEIATHLWEEYRAAEQDDEDDSGDIVRVALP